MKTMVKFIKTCRIIFLQQLHRQICLKSHPKTLLNRIFKTKQSFTAISSQNLCKTQRKTTRRLNGLQNMFSMDSYVFLLQTHSDAHMDGILSYQLFFICGPRVQKSSPLVQQQHLEKHYNLAADTRTSKIQDPNPEPCTAL